MSMISTCVSVQTGAHLTSLMISEKIVWKHSPSPTLLLEKHVTTSYNTLHLHLKIKSQMIVVEALHLLYHGSLL